MEDDGGGRFSMLFGREPEATARAPGRVNLIGEHTDYNGGFVLPMATPQKTVVELARRSDRTVRAHSADMGDGGETATFELGREERRGSWIDYVQGVTAALRAAELEIPGFDARIASNVPVGGGLSSSAALEVALLRALREVGAAAIDDVRIALLAQRAENDLVGAPVGVMDPMASSLASPGQVLFLDTRSLSFQLLPFPDTASLVVIDSGISHSHASGEYRARRGECERAAKLLGVAQLRDLAASDLPRISALEEPLGRRARHVVSEDERVLEAVTALRARDLETLGRLFDASHASMRDDFEVSVPDVDRLVEIARKERRAFGARMTGGGFGGAVIVLTERGADREIGERVTREYRRQTGRDGELLMPEPASSP